MDIYRLIKDSEHYRTDDLALATAIALYTPLEALDRHHAHGVQFMFRRSTYLDALLARYWRGQLIVEPQAYCKQLRVLLALYEETERG